jgi:DNA-binding NarL/FixJ family response regulator
LRSGLTLKSGTVAVSSNTPTLRDVLGPILWLVRIAPKIGKGSKMSERLSDGEVAVDPRFDDAVEQRRPLEPRVPGQPGGTTGTDRRRGADLSLPSTESIQAVLDAIENPVLIVRSDSNPWVANLAAERLLEEDARDGRTLALKIQSASREACRAPETGAEVEAGVKGRRYRVRASLLRGQFNEHPNRLVMVSVERTDSPLPSQAHLIERFNMTAREADVAILLARGTRNSGVAADLRISPHTARHHTENVLTKLGVHSRAEVARAIGSSSGRESGQKMTGERHERKNKPGDAVGFRSRLDDGLRTTG